MVLLRGGREVARWQLPPCADLALVDALARLQLAAGRAGGRIELRGVSGELRKLLELAGLIQVFRRRPYPGGTAGAGEPEGSAVEVGGEPEGGEEVGVEEVVVADDPAP